MLSWMILTRNNELIGCWTKTSSVDPCLWALAIWSSWQDCTFFYSLIVSSCLLFVVVKCLFTGCAKRKNCFLLYYFFISLFGRCVKTFRHDHCCYAFLQIFFGLNNVFGVVMLFIVDPLHYLFVDENRKKWEIWSVCCLEWY